MSISESNWSKNRVCLSAALALRCTRCQLDATEWRIKITAATCVSLFLWFLAHAHIYSVQVELNSGNNVLYWRTTGYTLQGSAVKPVMLRNIAISGRLLVSCVQQHLFLLQLLFPVNDYKLIGGLHAGVAYTSECFLCKPGTHSAKPGSARCAQCPAGSYSNKGATVCLQCDQDKYSGIYISLF